MKNKKNIAHDKFLDHLFSDVFDEVLQTSDMFKDTPEVIYEDGEEPVDIIEFIESKKFLNAKDYVYPNIKELLWHVMQDDVREADLLLGKGSGKTTAAAIFLAYGIYKTLCLKNPQAYFKIFPKTDPIYCILVSISEQQAKDVGFARVGSFIDNCPWFSDKIVKTTSRQIEFKKNIHLYSGHSGSTAFLGYATLYAVMDEVEFMVNSSNRSVSRDLYRALMGSQKTRFPNDYKLMMISSPNTEHGFLNTRVNRVMKTGGRVPFTGRYDNKEVV